MISKPLAKRVQKVFDKRDKIHPHKQKDLDFKTFSKKDLVEAFEVTDNLIEALEKYFQKEQLPPISFPEDDYCSYCTSGLFNNEGVCPACGEIIIN